ncbi:MAG: DUF2703 domain-containing protein [Candidatus Thermoplasmatota archaeon]|nr:DUF2703 domain-containing protein [Candidatus Thermoplasmatota archaeon]
MDRILEIDWKRQMKDGSTCPRCDETGSNIIEAISALEGYCGRRGIPPSTEKWRVLLEIVLSSSSPRIGGHKRCSSWIRSGR